MLKIHTVKHTWVNGKLKQVITRTFSNPRVHILQDMSLTIIKNETSNEQDIIYYNKK